MRSWLRYRTYSTAVESLTLYTEQSEQCLFGLEWTYSFATAFPKLSVLLLYFRLIPKKYFRLAVFVLVALVLGLCVSIIFAALFQCSPVAYAWNKSIKGGTCIDQLAYYRWITPPNLIIDLGILALPQPIIWGLHTSVEQKVGLTVTFLTASM